MYDIKHDLFKYSLLSIPLFIINGGHTVIAMFFLGIIPYHLYCNSQEKKRREEAYQSSLQHAKEIEERNRPYMLQRYTAYMREGSIDWIPEKDREYVRQLIKEEDAARARRKAKRFVLTRPPEVGYEPRPRTYKKTNCSRK